jgi:hypothetical protein
MSVYDPENFIGRVNLAASYIAAGRHTTRTFDTCFEMWDGDAVAAALVRRADANPSGKLAKNLFHYITEDTAREASVRLGSDLAAEAAKQREVSRRQCEEWACERAARAVGWEKRDSHFTRCGVSVAYVDWKTLCAAEGIQP